jgi:curli biogenesis system outer membrane secretion channel CsgG
MKYKIEAYSEIMKNDITNIEIRIVNVKTREIMVFYPDKKINYKQFVGLEFNLIDFIRALEENKTAINP